uniref:high affinity immunoglobulin epsilon receptor subunit beta-like n=1 Tax=Pristiophorus japonicus TaxID=55135 RepID=UPI00398E3A28
MNLREDATDREDSSSDLDDPTTGNWANDLPATAPESGMVTPAPSAVTTPPNTPKLQHPNTLTFSPSAQEQPVDTSAFEMQPPPPSPHFTRLAPSTPQQSPQQFNKPSVSKPADTREVDKEAHHEAPEPTAVPVAIQVTSSASAASAELWVLRRELKALGATQILIGFIQLVFGVPLSMSMIYSVAGKSGVSFWTGIWYIISGSLTVELKRKPTRWIMKAGLLMNSVSAGATTIGIILYSISLLFTPTPEALYYSMTTFSLTIALLLFTVLEMGVAVIIAFYNYKSLFHFENAYAILHDVIAKHPSPSS